MLDDEILESVRIAVIRRFAGRVPPNVDLDDLVSEGQLAAIEAAPRWDSARGASLRTFLEPRAIGAVQDFLRASDPLSRSRRTWRRQWQEAIRSASQRLGRRVVNEEVADEMGLTVEDMYRKIYTSTVRHQDLDGPAMHGIDASVSDRSHTLAEILPDNAEPADESLHAVELKALIEDAIERLPEKQQMVIAASFYGGLLDVEIADMLGVTESRVCQIVNKALEQLARYLEARL